ncbi:MAG: GNAT family N-acetyltransferase [Alphaproteobacteria bacterium]
MVDIRIRPIDAQTARPLRHAVLRPNQSLDSTQYPGDDAPETGHFGCFLKGVLVGIASVYREPSPDSDDARAWRLRGMATAAEVRGLGCGRALLDAIVGHAAGQGADLIWCNARTSAAGFYLGAGFEQVGEEYDLPGIGAHLFMHRRLPKAAPGE